MISTLTRAELTEELNRRISVTEKYPDLETAQIDAIICKLALAAMDSEPVKRVNADQMHRVCLEANRHLDKYVAMAKEVNKLLGRTPAQPAPVVPNEIKHRIGGLDWGWEGEFNRGWNACRAAMLNGGNS